MILAVIPPTGVIGHRSVECSSQFYSPNQWFYVTFCWPEDMVDEISRHIALTLATYRTPT